MARTLLDVWAERDGPKPQTTYRWASTKPPAQPRAVVATPGPAPGSSWLVPTASAVLCVVLLQALVEPNLISTRHDRSEASAIGSLRTLNTAQSIYREWGKEILRGRPQYADSLAELSATGTDLVDDVLGTGEKSAYRFRIATGPDGTHWDAEAHALRSRSTRRFYTNQSGVIYFSADDPMEPVSLTGGRGGPPAGFRALGW